MVHSLQSEMNNTPLMHKKEKSDCYDRVNGKRKTPNLKSSSKVPGAGKGTKFVPYSLPREMVPKLIWEPGILTGYRPMNKPWTFYFRSLFWIHNDTGNVWTHLISPFVTFAVLYSFRENIDFYNNPSAQGFIVFTVGSCCLFFFSAAANLLHSKSETAHYLTFCFDYMGIALYGYGQATLAFYCSGTPLFYEIFASSFNWIAAILATACTIGNTLARTLYWKPCFTKKFLQVSPCCMSFIWSQLAAIFRMFECWNQDGCIKNFNVYHGLSWGFVILNGILFALHQPERTFPGKFDILGHGHQWFHLGVLGGTLTILYGSYVDMLETPGEVLQIAKPNVWHMWMNFSLVVLVNLGVKATFYYIYKVKSIKRD